MTAWALVWRGCAKVAVVSLSVLSGCASSRVTDPKVAADTFAAAARKGDGATLYGMLSPAAQASLSPADVAKLVTAERGELDAMGTALSTPLAVTHARARLRFDDGEEVSLDLADGHFGVTSAGALPGGASSPEALLGDLRRAIARRSYTSLLRVLSPETRSAIENDLRTLVLGLEHPETLPVRTTGDDASAVVPGGHHVSMKREGGVWRVDDFD